MGAVFSILAYSVFLFFVIKKVRQARMGQGSQDQTKSMNRPQSATAYNAPRSGMPAGPRRSHKVSGVNAHMAREKINIKGWEDRKGDWLARQMAEEKFLERKLSDMFQMKMEHRHSCEAEMLRRFHEGSCDAEAVDTAEPR
ncbi:MAG: hypothetical protein IKS87_01530 [Lachnospiraceae bacterium]|nr:hypothetical protein [Lachnospiraceae bacterium]